MVILNPKPKNSKTPHLSTVAIVIPTWPAFFSGWAELAWFGIRHRRRCSATEFGKRVLMGTRNREPQECSRNRKEYKDPGRIFPSKFLLYSCGSLFGVPSKKSRYLGFRVEGHEAALNPPRSEVSGVSIQTTPTLRENAIQAPPARSSVQELHKPCSTVLRWTTSLTAT